MRQDSPNISKVASDLILAYKQLLCQQNETIISPRYEKTAFYFPSSPIEEQIEEENQLDSPRKSIIQNDVDYYLKEISDLRRIVEQMRMKYMNIPERYLSQTFKSYVPNNQNYSTTTIKQENLKQKIIKKQQTDLLRQKYGKI